MYTLKQDPSAEFYFGPLSSVGSKFSADIRLNYKTGLAFRNREINGCGANMSRWRRLKSTGSEEIPVPLIIFCAGREERRRTYSRKKMEVLIVAVKSAGVV